MTLTVHKSHVHCSDIMQWWACSWLNPLLCLQRQIAKLVSALFYYWRLLRNNNMATNLQRFTSSCVSSVLLHVTVERRHLGRYMQRVTADSTSHILWYYVKRNVAANKAHILELMFHRRCATAQYNQTIVAVKSHSCALATFQNIWKTRKQRALVWIINTKKASKKLCMFYFEMFRIILNPSSVKK